MQVVNSIVSSIVWLGTSVVSGVSSCFAYGQGAIVSTTKAFLNSSKGTQAAIVVGALALTAASIFLVKQYYYAPKAKKTGGLEGVKAGVGGLVDKAGKQFKKITEKKQESYFTKFTKQLKSLGTSKQKAVEPKKGKKD